MKTDFDIVIAGAGMVGACAATLLAKTPICPASRIALIDAKPPAPARTDVDIDLRVSAISRGSERILAACGVRDAVLSDRSHPYQRMQVWDASSAPDGGGVLKFDAAEVGEPNLGYIVENRWLQWHLFEAAVRSGVTVFRQAVTALDLGDAQATVTLAEGRSLSAALVIGADGADSPLREFAGIETKGWGYAQEALVSHIRTELAHADTARQRFLESGPIALLPLADGRSSIVWSTTPEQAEAMREIDADDFARAIEQATDGVLGSVTLAAPRASFPLRLAHAIDYTRPRFVLIGDAAHAVHPLAGLGVNLGFLDAAALTETLVDARAAGAELGDLKPLRRYERWRKSENLAAMGMLDGINRLFSNGNPALSGLRRAGLGAVNQLGPVKNFFIRRALGTAGELPRAAK
ncbi:MAG TPA: UbiH/UbiF/VisC/COQ6 family ubiquinone biosynthesis hydroxylase [Steroidobacteraceae bacterium]|nr:UbiH/UbiF/VisC/COQ6 family ubiquinone biosynthesis hydroxylase [Steroidobacteraceae bacterium]